MDDRKSGDHVGVYLELAKEHYAWNRHHEAQRSTICSIIIVFAALLLSAIELSGDSSFDRKMIGVCITVSGFFGVIFVCKQYERMKLHRAGFHYYKKLIAQEIDVSFGEEAQSINQDEQYARLPRFLKTFHLLYYWSFLMGFVVLIGLYVVFSSSGA